MKNPLISILVHTKNSERTIGEHLKSIKNQSYKNIEIILVDNNSTDNTLPIAKKYIKKIFTFGPERSAQRNYGAKKSSGDYLLVPDSDMIFEKDVVLECIKTVSKNPLVKAVVIPEKSIGVGFWAQCKIFERSFYIGIPWMEGARFFERKVFFEMNGYDEENTGTEDYDLPHRIEKKYGKESIGRIEKFITHDEGKLSLFKTMKKKFYYAQKLDIYKRENIIYFKMQANLLLRLQLFFSHPVKLAKNPMLSSGMIVMKLCEFIAGGLGYIIRKRINVYGQ